jgi:hypothetical protein
MRDTIEEYLAKEYEGKLFVNIFLLPCFGSYTVRKDYYTVLNGLVYSTHEGELHASGDTMLSLQTDCKKIGKYNPDKKYKTTTRNYSYSEIKKLFKL